MKDYLEKRREELKERGESGFTLMEMLIVVAIIAVLIAIAIPVFTNQLENSREATDAANLRSAYATASASLLTGDGKKGVSAGPVVMGQATEDWQNDSIKTQKIGTVAISGSVDLAKAVKGVSFYVNVGSDGSMSITKGVAASDFMVVDPITGAVTRS